MDAARAYMIGLRHNLRNQPHLSTLPSSPRIDDTFLVEFPKSGITWLTFLIASVNLQKSGIERQPTFFAINDLVPDIHVSRHLPPPLPFPDMRFIKSHAGYNPLYSKVIYLVRDPRDVMVSYYAFARKLGWYNGSLHDMIKDPQFGIKAWVAHANSWLDETKPSVSFNVIRYEDLMRRSKEKKTFVYFLTLNTHLPNDAALADGSPAVCPDTATDKVCTLLKAHENFFAGLAGLLKDPTLPPIHIVLVGDHAPPFADLKSRQKFSDKVVPFLEIVPK
jgi:hypothetical protein